MKNNLVKYYIAGFYFCSTFILFAQPGSGSDNGGIDDSGTLDSTPVAPIDDYLWLLTVVAVVLAVLKFRARIRQANQLSK